jgi:hypothetical protein
MRKNHYCEELYFAVISISFEETLRDLDVKGRITMRCILGKGGLKFWAGQDKM